MAQIITFPHRQPSHDSAATPIAPAPSKFEPGQTYATRSIGDSNCWVRIKIAKRTAKTITTDEGKTFRISVYDGIEQVRPWGNYSMCPIIGADDLRPAS